MSSQSHFGLAGKGLRSLHAAPKGSRGAAVSQHHRVMIVEDEFFVAWHLETLAKEFGLDVIGLLPDGESAVEQFADMAADLVLMDIHLAGSIDGVEAARRIRERHDAAVIFISAFADPATVSRIEQAVPGAQVLSKPVSADRLRSAIGRVLPARPH